MYVIEYPNEKFPKPTRYDLNYWRDLLFGTHKLKSVICNDNIDSENLNFDDLVPLINKNYIIRLKENSYI